MQTLTIFLQIFRWPEWRHQNYKFDPIQLNCRWYQMNKFLTSSSHRFANVYLDCIENGTGAVCRPIVYCERINGLNFSHIIFLPTVRSVARVYKKKNKGVWIFSQLFFHRLANVYLDCLENGTRAVCGPAAALWLRELDTLALEPHADDLHCELEDSDYRYQAISGSTTARTNAGDTILNNIR